MKRKDDAQLIHEILSGNEAAFSRLIQKYQKSVHALAWRKIGDFHYAEEITQDTFLQVYKKLSTLKNPAQFAGWLYVIANRHCIAWMRKRKPTVQSLEETPVKETEKSDYERYVSEQREAEAIERRYELVEKLLEKLPESERTIVTLYYLGEMTLKEIGNFLGVSVNTIASRLRRARKRLQADQELLIQETLGGVRLSENLTKNIMRHVTDIDPTPPTATKPLLPWIAVGAFTILVILLFGTSNRYLVRFQKPYSFEAASQPTIEIVDAPVIHNIDAKPAVRNQIGQTVSEDEKGNADPQISQKDATSDTQGDSPKRNKTIQVDAYWAPIADTALNSPKHAALFHNLSPTHPSQEYGTDAFSVFFPKKSFTVGHLWTLDAKNIILFLRQFHPGATAEMHNNPGTEFVLEVFGLTLFRSSRFESEGAYACIRAVSPNYVEIVFRIHAEFLLDGEADAYFTPAQFTGRLILNRKYGTIREFWLYVPPRNTNVDLHAHGLADTVFVPRMELVGRNTQDQRDIVWKTAITEKEAKDMLEAAFYKFSEIERCPIEGVVAQAQAKKRPIHVVLTKGAFDDESCCGTGKTLRTFVLSDSKVIKLLNKHYLSVFLLLSDLPELQNGAKGDQISKLATRVTETYEKTLTHNPDYSVNSFVLSPQLELIDHLPYGASNKPYMDAKEYHTFLMDALETVKRH